MSNYPRRNTPYTIAQINQLKLGDSPCLLFYPDEDGDEECVQDSSISMTELLSELFGEIVFFYQYTSHEEIPVFKVRVSDTEKLLSKLDLFELEEDALYSGWTSDTDPEFRNSRKVKMYYPKGLCPSDLTSTQYQEALEKVKAGWNEQERSIFERNNQAIQAMAERVNAKPY